MSDTKPIAPPSASPEDPSYNIECQQAIELALMAVVDQAAIAGWETARVLSAAREVIEQLAVGYEQDPDPDDAPSELGDDTSV